MTTPKLSICIATLNRAAFLGETLDSIIAQATDEVEIVVVDGASTDNTEELVRGYQQRFPRLNYLRLEAKGGVDKDYCRTVELARGEYCWLMSDDDLLKLGAIQAVLDATRHGYGLIIVNAEVRSPDLSSVVEPKRLRISADRVYTPANIPRLLVDTATYMTFIGCVVIKRQLWNAREKEKHIGTEFIHVGVIFQSPLPEDTLVIAHPWIAIRHGRALWASRYFQIWMFQWPGLIWSLPDYPDSVKRQVCPKEPWRATKILLVLRAKGAFSLKEYRTWIEPRAKSRAERWVAKTIALMPGCLVNPPVWIYFSLFRPREQYGIREFKDSPFYFTNCLGRLYRGIFRVLANA